MSANKCSECGEVHLAGANGAIYCCGSLLRAVQLSGMFSDSKYFVDMISRSMPDRILADWQLFCACKKNESSVKQLSHFVETHFEQPGSEMEYWNPPDWRCEPAFLANIKDPSLRKFGTALNRIWKQLGRQIKPCVKSNPLLYSLVYVPNPFIVSAGNSLEYYYWDTYWIVRGLLFSGMWQTARGMIDNLLYIVSQFRFVPCGGRIYYWGRSQPPLLVAMVKLYVDMTKDHRYAVQVLPILEMEMDYFMKNHVVQVKGRLMFQYRDKSSGPRPEAYREDTECASSFATDEEKEEHYSNLKAACESGQNFSSRWFVSDCGRNVGTLASTRTNYLVPVDLNCIIFRNCKTLAEFNTWAGNTNRSEHYKNASANLIRAIMALLWNEERGMWFDYDLKNKLPRDFFVVTNLSPLWARAYPINNADKITESVLNYVKENNLDSYPGGVPQTLSNTGELWDYPNVWPPMMLMLIEGLNNLGTPAAKELSQSWRQRWVRTTYESFIKTGFMYPKYNCEEFGNAGYGKDAISQTGYGPTNAVLLELLARYGQELTASDACKYSEEEALSGQYSSGLETCPITSLADMENEIPADCRIKPTKDCEKPTAKEVCSNPPEPAIVSVMQSVATSDCDCEAEESTKKPPASAPAPAPAVVPQSVESICPICQAAYNCNEATAMSSNPIQIEMNEVNCLQDLSPSQEQQIEEMCNCDEDTQLDNDQQGKETEEDEECVIKTLCTSEQFVVPTSKNKIFPLADLEDNCVEEEAKLTEELGCICNNTNVANSATLAERRESCD